jgi:hypothetical protein
MNFGSAITVSRHSTRESREFALQQIYQQVLERQPYTFERKELEKIEQDFLKDKIGVRRFLKELGHSDLYLRSFYYQASGPKFVETCIKHFLGRSIRSAEEMRFYSDILLKEGVKKLVTAVLDSDEYRREFGCFTVPYVQSPSVYSSPKTFFETRTLNQEHYGQRGQSLPTMYWHQLGLDCETGVCHHPEVEEAVKASPVPRPASSILGQSKKSVQEMSLQELLDALESPDAQETVAALSDRQRATLRRIVSQR